MEAFQTSCAFGILISGVYLFIYLLDKLAGNLVKLFIS